MRKLEISTSPQHQFTHPAQNLDISTVDHCRFLVTTQSRDFRYSSQVPCYYTISGFHYSSQIPCYYTISIFIINISLSLHILYKILIFNKISYREILNCCKICSNFSNLYQKHPNCCIAYNIFKLKRLLWVKFLHEMQQYNPQTPSGRNTIA